MSRFILFTFSYFALLSCNELSSQGEAFLQEVDQNAAGEVYDLELEYKGPKPTAFEAFPTGQVRPEGWILEMMNNDLEQGMVGHLDELYPGISKDDLYGSARRAGVEDVPEMGDLVLTGAAWETSIMWWNAETIGNWWDGFVRHAFLSDNQSAMQQATAIVNGLLDSQDEDGYIGIYKENLRYRHKGSNGELWAQTTAFRTLLGYYEITGELRVLAAVERAMELTMKEYGPEGRSPFDLEGEFGGVTHGLMLVDVCETLERITSKGEYLDYAAYLYQEFSKYPLNRAFNDLRLPYLLKVDSAYESHAVHTYEHLRALAAAYYRSNDPRLKKGYDAALIKLANVMLPSGAGHGNEWIAGKEADPSTTGQEYCSMLELRNSFGSLLQKSGNAAFAQSAEELTYNAMLGSRNKSGTALAYGTLDNCYIMDGHHHENGERTADPRYKYSPTHSEPAVCCVPNYGRNLTYFLNQMWMRSPGGIAALMYGPSTLKTQVEGQAVTLHQRTNYPYEHRIAFEVETDDPVYFTFTFRVPTWAKLQSSIPVDSVSNGYAHITRQWVQGDALEVNFESAPTVKDFKGRKYLTYGPLVYAKDIPAQRENIKSYALEGFHDYYCTPSTPYKEHELLATSAVQQVEGENYPLLLVKTVREGVVEMDTLIPFGQTTLRQTTFTQRQ